MHQLQKLSYTHEALVDLVIAQPGISHGEIAETFGRTTAWVSVVVNSDSFRERLAARKEAIVDPILRSTMEDRLRAVCDKSLEVLMERLEVQRNANVAVRVLEHSSRALGYGIQTAKPVQVNTYVALIPPKSATSEAWIEQHAPLPVVTTVEVQDAS